MSNSFFNGADISGFIQSQNNMALHAPSVSNTRIEWMLTRLRELDIEVVFITDPPFWGSYKGTKDVIEVNRLLFTMPYLMEQTILHEFIHVLQQRGYFIPKVEYEEIYISCIGVSQDYYWQRRAVEREMGYWPDKMNHTLWGVEIWLLEAVAMYMQTNFELFEVWWECEMT